MSYQKHNFEAGAVLFASQLNDMDNQIEALSNQESTLSENFKIALLNCFENVAWINENGQTYYDALYDSLYPDNMWFITNILTGCVTSNNATSILKNNSYVATITASEGYILDGATVSITMGGNDVTNLYYSSGSINIPNVTGDLVITVLASSAVTSISAVFTQGSAVIYDTDSLDTLKQYLTVTATYSDSTTATVTNYTLSGTLTVGTSTITANYGGKSTTFTVVTTWGYKLSELFTSNGSSSIDTTKTFENGNTYTVAVEFFISAYDANTNNFVGNIWGNNTTDASGNYIALQENEAPSGTSKGKYCWGAGISWSAGKNIVPVNNTIRIVHIITMNGENDNSISASFKNITTSGAVQTFSTNPTDNLETDHIIHIGNPSTNRGFKGTVSNFVMEKRAWSSAEITAFLEAS